MYDIWERWPTLDNHQRKIHVHVAEQGQLTCLCGCFAVGTKRDSDLDARRALSAQVRFTSVTEPYPSKPCQTCRNRLVRAAERAERLTV